MRESMNIERFIFSQQISLVKSDENSFASAQVFPLNSTLTFMNNSDDLLQFKSNLRVNRL